MDFVLYARQGCVESAAMRVYLNSRGFDYEERQVDGDPGAKRAWEDLDGQVTPLLVIDNRQIVRGLDRARLDQLTGWIGC